MNTRTLAQVPIVLLYTVIECVHILYSIYRYCRRRTVELCQPEHGQGWAIQVPGEVRDVVELCQPEHGQGWAILVPGEVRDVVELCQPEHGQTRGHRHCAHHHILLLHKNLV